MKDRIESFAEFLYRRRFGLGESDPLPPKDDSVWRAFRRQAKDIILFTDAQDATETEADRWKRRFLGAVEDNQELKDELFELRKMKQEVSEYADSIYHDHPSIGESLNRILGY